jgi:hypothetical protein
MNAGMRFLTGAVLQHAAVVGEVADQMAQARSALHEITMDRQAYGELCQFLPELLSPLFGSAVEVLNDAVDALSETALDLRTTTSDVQDTDADNARRLTDTAGPGPERSR